jgi:16S rRNA (cytosine1402-N4)-methyltransferase
MYHIPVMLERCVSALVTDVDGIYVDVTFGGGGHSRKILEVLSRSGKLYGFDQDKDAAANCPGDDRFKLFEANFRYLERYLRLEGIRQVDGILADLGVSSFQLDEVERGFTHRANTKLDMRMNQSGEKSAMDVLNTYTEEQLWRVFGNYGEVRNSKTLAKAIVVHRQQQRIKTVDDLMVVLSQHIMGDRHRYLSQVFQALRIEVNEEMESLKDMLEGAAKVLKPGGRLVVLSYHSLEDRIVKNFIKTGTFDGEPIKDEYGRIDRPFHVLTKKPEIADAEELRQNSRSRSAKLRIAEKK